MNKKMLMLKKVTALVMAGMMCLQFTACGSEKKKEEKLESYNVEMQAEIKHNIGSIKIEDGELYTSYYDYEDVTAGTEESHTKCGLVTYNFETKEIKEAEFEEDMYPDEILKDGEGNYIVKGAIYQEDNLNDIVSSAEKTEEDEMVYTYKEVTYKYDKDLNIIAEPEYSQTITKSYDDDDDFLVSKECTDDGKVVELYQSMDNDECYINVSDSEGNALGQIKIDGEEQADTLLKLSNGEILCSKWTKGKQKFYKVDIEKLKISEEVFETPGYSYQIYAGSNDNVLGMSNGIIYNIDYKENKSKKILKLIDSDINPDNVIGLFELKDGTIGCVTTSDDGNSAEIDIFKKKDSNEKEKTEIKLGTFYIDSDLQEKVIKYNKTNDKYRIVVTEYYDEDDDFSQAMSKFNSDVTSGKCPDIIDFSGMESELSKYGEKGVLEDLLPYFNKDEDTKIENFVSSVVETYKTNDKLYALPQKFYITGYVGATEKVGKNINWTLDEFMELAKSLPEGVNLFYGMTSDTLLSICTTNIERYVDWKTGECKFDSEEFIKLLEFSNEYESDEDFYKNADDENYIDEDTLIRENKIVLKNCFMASAEDYMVEKAIFGKDITFKGVPVSEGNGVTLTGSGSLLTISAKSKYKDVGWDFIKSLYTTEDEEDMINAFPVRQSDLDKMFEEAKKPNTYIDENGQEQIEENIWTINDVEVKVATPTDEDINALKNIINSGDNKFAYDSEIDSMITEEAEAYFKGQKTAKEVAQIIQSRVSMYVKENK